MYYEFITPVTRVALTDSRKREIGDNPRHLPSYPGRAGPRQKAVPPVTCVPRLVHAGLLDYSLTRSLGATQLKN